MVYGKWPFVCGTQVALNTGVLRSRTGSLENSSQMRIGIYRHPSPVFCPGFIVINVSLGSGISSREWHGWCRRADHVLFPMAALEGRYLSSLEANFSQPVPRVYGKPGARVFFLPIHSCHYNRTAAFTFAKMEILRESL